MSQTRDQQRFTISEEAADWYEPISFGAFESVYVLRRHRSCRDYYYYYYYFFLNFKPSKNEGRKKIEKVKKNGEANVPSGRPTQNYCATKQN